MGSDTTVQALDGREDVLEGLGPVARDPALAESVVSQRMPEGRATLVEDLLPVSDEQEAGPRQGHA